jgi:hypothetical protein
MSKNDSLYSDSVIINPGRLINYRTLYNSKPRNVGTTFLMKSINFQNELVHIPDTYKQINNYFTILGRRTFGSDVYIPYKNMKISDYSQIYGLTHSKESNFQLRTPFSAW